MPQAAHYAESHLMDLLASFGMDVPYVRAERNTLFYRDGDGAEVPVLDLVGGFGSLILGHNPPEIRARVQELLDTQAPVHIQLSRNDTADQVGQLLNKIIQREFPDTEDYRIVYGNSGAEAVEIALKHAELDRLMRVSELFQALDWNASQALAAVKDGRATLPDDPSALPDGIQLPTDAVEFERLLGELTAHNAALAAQSPVYFALEGGFHGKLVGSVQVSHSPAVRVPFAALGFEAVFVPPNRLDVLQHLVDEKRATALDVTVTDGRVRVVTRDFPVFGGFLLEPVQGEGGIHVLPEDLLSGLKLICEGAGCPVVVDEIQTGMGRTGAFLAASHHGFPPDYLLLGKSLGGGVAKVSATLIRSSRYRPVFDLMHSSTFAKDGFSTEIALSTLRLLEADDGRVYRLARERGARITDALRGVAADFPDVLREIRGTGLLIGVEFAPRNDSPSTTIREKSRGGLLSFLSAGYLLRAHGVRVVPTGSDLNVLRIEPSVHISDQEIAQLEAGVRDLCLILRNGDARPLIEAATATGRATQHTVRDFRNGAEESAVGEGDTKSAGVGTEGTESAVRKAAFISCLPSAAALRERDPSLDGLSDERLADYCRRQESFATDMPPLPPVRITSPTGTAVDLTLYPLLATRERTAERIGAGDRDRVLADLDARVRTAVGDGCGTAGLDPCTASATGEGSVLRVPRTVLTGGGALLAATAVRTLERAAAARLGELDPLTLAVVTDDTHLGPVCAALGADTFSQVVLVTDDVTGARTRIYQELWSRIAEGGELRGVPALLAKEPLIDGWLRDGRPGDEPSGDLIAAYVDERHGDDFWVHVTEDPTALRQAHAVLSATAGPLPPACHAQLREGAVVCETGIPAAGSRPARVDVTWLRGDLLATPNGESLPMGIRGAVGEGLVPAGVAETAALALTDARPGHPGSVLTARHARAMADLADRHGFTLPDGPVSS
ncbi:hypothetical protein SGFS_005590 [Streptomyces graminofaciens]|uniref:Aminotransferase class III-fold pyridoxal phosphate-dependent enzyme n=1 Tax=Streptomyces graminofaciens TaxID=68212 RepID=A0ABN5V8N0_9ACTN|nr:aminotransferase class III-fold pyridoxal phosphate-dependent enzyme [Streptomyces graminofaciens]BBC29265.1 hypothetical protein SGFS_005590 [Streptomyces graminofaciens]